MPARWTWDSTGPGPGPDNVTDVHGYSPQDTGAPVFTIDAYGVDRYGLNVAIGDIDGNGMDEILTGREGDLRRFLIVSEPARLF